MGYKHAEWFNIYTLLLKNSCQVYKQNILLTSVKGKLRVSLRPSLYGLSYPNINIQKYTFREFLPPIPHILFQVKAAAYLVARKMLHKNI